MLRKFLIVLSVIFCFIAIAILILRHYYNTGALQEAVLDTVINRVASIDKNATSTQENVFLLKQLLGFEQKQNYLILFLNNQYVIKKEKDKYNTTNSPRMLFIQKH